MQKRGFNLLIIFGFIVLLSGFISAVWCGIVPKTSCTSTGGRYIVMGVSGLTNAHGEFPYSSYPYVLCCDFQKKRGTTCVGTNKIIGLSSLTNAHAEIPSRTTYTNPVCYDDLECKNTLGSCPSDYPLPVISLSNYTNAHIGNISDYPIKICCKGSATAALTCQLTNASWEYQQVMEGIKVDLFVKGTNCNGVTVSFEVLEDDGIAGSEPVTANPADAVFSDNTAKGQWTAEWQNDNQLIKLQTNPPEYYFIVKVVGTSKTINSKSIGNPLLKVEQIDPGYCPSIATCGGYTTEPECNSDLCNRAVNSAPPEVNCNDPSIECSCLWNGEINECGFIASTAGGTSEENETIWGGTCKYKEQTTDDCSDGYLTYNWTATWTGNESERPSWCIDGSKVIECPAQVQLPFFNTYTLITVIIIIALIYVMLSKRRKKKTGSKRRGKEKK